MSDPDLTTGETPAGCWFSDDGVTTIVAARARTLPLGLFALVFALFWASGIGFFVMLAVGATIQVCIGDVPEWYPLWRVEQNEDLTIADVAVIWAFLTPFVLLVLAIAAVPAVLLMGRVEVRVRGDEGAVFSGVGRFGWIRRFDASRVDAVSEPASTSALPPVRLNGIPLGRPVPMRPILIEADRDLRFGLLLSEKRRAWMAAALRRLLLHPATTAA